MVSPNANYLTCFINKEFFIKALNQANNSQDLGNLAYHQSLLFFPLLLDLDFNNSQKPAQPAVKSKYMATEDSMVTVKFEKNEMLKCFSSFNLFQQQDNNAQSKFVLFHTAKDLYNFVTDYIENPAILGKFGHMSRKQMEYTLQALEIARFYP